MTRIPKLAVAAGISALLGLATPAFAAGEQAFEARTTAQLVSLCSTPPADPTYAQSLQFCHGFAAGALSYYRATRRPGAAPCYAGDNPVDSLFRFLDANYACR